MTSSLTSLDSGGQESTIWSLAGPLPVHVDWRRLYGDLDRAEFLDDSKVLRLKRGGRARFDRLLNVFAYDRWVARTGVNTLAVQVAHQGGGGRFSILCYDGQTTRLVSCTRLEPSDAASITRVALPPKLKFADLLFFQVDADEPLEIAGIDIVTPARPIHKVRLGLVITTFNRQAEVEEQIEQLEALQDADLDYHLFVVDNGRNLQLARRYRHTTVIPSPNLGGAGGFTRGLLELIETGGFTHALFMDDDAFCHPEAIARAVAMLSFATDPRLALTGAMNYLHDPELQYELGGRLAGYGVSSIRMDVRTDGLRALFDNETAQRPDYGAWWCFLFPLKAVRALPFPFFVRGDDITFSLQNSFEIETFPGLVAWQPSFEYKIGASVEYLVHRSFLTMPLLASRPEWSLASIRGGVERAFAAELHGLRYPMAEAICAALHDVLTGPEFWANTANTVARMQELGAAEKAFSERSHLPNWGYLPPGAGQGLVVRLLRRLIGEANLPARLCFRRPALTNYMTPQPGQAFLRRGIIYHAPDGSKSLSCARDWRWRGRLERRFAGLMGEYAERFEALTADYRAAGWLQSREAWNERLHITPAERSVANSPL